MEIIIISALALAPGFAISLYIWVRDEYEHEPLRLLIWCFILGMISTIPAVFLEVYAKTIFGMMNENDIFSTGFHAFALVGFVEELCKFVVLMLFAYPKEDFNEPFDGIVYSVIIAMGFATLENILYVVDGGYSTAFLRMFTAVPAHATFGVLMGFFVGRAKYYKKLSYIVSGLLAAALFHGSYDFFLFLSSTPLLTLGAFVSLYAGIKLSKKAINFSVEISPFRK